MDYKVVDKRGDNKEPPEVCRVCGSLTVHTRIYNSPGMDCINHLRKQVKLLEIYQKYINKIDDYFEYRYAAEPNAKAIKSGVSDFLSALTIEIRDLK